MKNVRSFRRKALYKTKNDKILITFEHIVFINYDIAVHTFRANIILRRAD